MDEIVEQQRAEDGEIAAASSATVGEASEAEIVESGARNSGAGDDLVVADTAPQRKEEQAGAEEQEGVQDHEVEEKELQEDDREEEEILESGNDADRVDDGKHEEVEVDESRAGDVGDGDDQEVRDDAEEERVQDEIPSAEQEADQADNDEDTQQEEEQKPSEQHDEGNDAAENNPAAAASSSSPSLPPQPPSAVKGLRVKEFSSTTALIEWDKEESGLDELLKFQVQYCQISNTAAAAADQQQYEYIQAATVSAPPALVHLRCFFLFFGNKTRPFHFFFVFFSERSIFLPFLFDLILKFSEHAHIYIFLFRELLLGQGNSFFFVLHKRGILSSSSSFFF